MRARLMVAICLWACGGGPGELELSITPPLAPQIGVEMGVPLHACAQNGKHPRILASEVPGGNSGRARRANRFLQRPRRQRPRVAATVGQPLPDSVVKVH